MAKRTKSAAKPAVEQESDRDPRQPQSMSFVGGVAKFLSRYASFQVWPLGGAKHVVVGNPDGSHEKEYLSKPLVEFVRNQYETQEYEIAYALIVHKKFGSPGWALDPGCLPAPVAKRWPGLALNQQQEVALALCNGLTPLEAMSGLPKATANPKEEEVVSMFMAVCPVKGCLAPPISAIDAGSDKKARSLIEDHVRVTHPGWSEEALSSFPPDPHGATA